MNRTCVVLALVASFCSTSQALELKITLIEEQVYRGTSYPVEGLAVKLDLINNSAIPLSLPKPSLHDTAAPGMAVKAVITRTLEDGTISKPVEQVKDNEKGFEEREKGLVRIEAGQSETFRVEVGSLYDFSEAGKYRMHLEFAGEKSNEIEFTLLPLRRLQVPRKVLMERFAELERGNSQFHEMFYVLPTRRSWDELFLVFRLAHKEQGQLIFRNIGYLPRGTMPKMVLSAPGVYGLLLADRVNDGWRFVSINLTKDPPEFNFKKLDQKEEPTLSLDFEGKPQVE